MIKVKKSEFLYSLKNILSELPEQELKDIMYDYEEHFIIGLENGKSEEEMCEELGDPNEIAKNYLSNNIIMPKVPVPVKRNIIIPSVVIAIICVLIVAMFIAKANDDREKRNARNLASNFGITINDKGVNVGGMKIDDTGIHGNGIEIGSDGVHAPGIDIDSNGVHGAGISIDNKGVNVDIPNIDNNSKSEKIKVHENKSLELKGITCIYLDNSSTNIKIIPQKSSKLNAELVGEVSINSKPNFSLSTSGTNAYITLNTQDTVSNNAYSYSNLSLTIYIPSNYHNAINLKSSSGDIDVKKLTLDNINFKVQSGNINLTNINSRNLELNSQSGNLEGSNIISKNSNFSVTSGNVDMDDFTGNIVTKCESGNIDLSFKTFNNNVDISTTSGNIQLNIPKSSDFKLASKSEFGKIDINFPITNISNNNPDDTMQTFNGTIGKSNNIIILDATSGDININ